MFCAAAWTFPFLNIMIKGYGYGQKKGNSDHDKGGGIIPCRPGVEGYYFPRLSVPVLLNEESAATDSSSKRFK